MRGPAELQAFIDTQGIPAELLRLDAPTPTVETAAAAVGCQPAQVIKTILFRIDGQPVVAITSGLNHVDRRSLAARYRVGRKKVKLAGPEDVVTTLGYSVGGVPPIGFSSELPVVIDPAVLAHEVIYAGGGDDHTLMRIAPQVIQALHAAETLDLHMGSENRSERP